jgi:hypothetical protein
VDRGRPRAEVVLLRGDQEVARWALTHSGPPDLGLVDEVARLQLSARRAGCRIWLRHACPDLVGLLDLVGLRELVALQLVGEAEDFEEAGVEEVVVPDDPVA